MTTESLDPHHFRDKLAEWLAWAAENFPSNPDWCARHWAPCPVGGRNGVAAAVVMFRESLQLMPPAVVRAGGTAIESWRHNQLVPACCRLGDERVAAVWALVGLEDP
jgi:hypothetical protein